MKLPPEIALQDSLLEDFSPISTPSPPPRQTHTFQRTHPNPAPTHFNASSTRSSDPLDIASLGISDRPSRFAPFKSGSAKMDWNPSPHQLTFNNPKNAAPYSALFASAKGTLPSAPGTSFLPSPTHKPTQPNFFSAANQTSKLDREQGKEEFTLGRQRLFAPQETTGLEALLGQALTLEDEPTIVRAVKSVKRSMERNNQLRKSIIALTISSVAGIVAAVVGVPVAYSVWGIARVAISRGRLSDLSAGMVATLFAMWIGLPYTGIEVPYHRLLLVAYHPSIQLLAHRIGVTILVVILSRDVARVVQIKTEQRRKAKEKEEARQQKMRGIFYTPRKEKGGTLVR